MACPPQLTPTRTPNPPPSTLHTPQSRRQWLIEHGPATLEQLRRKLTAQAYTLNGPTTTRCLTALDYAANYLPTLQRTGSSCTSSPLAPRADLDCLHNLYTAANILTPQGAITATLASLL